MTSQNNEAMRAIEKEMIRLIGFNPITGDMWWKEKPNRNIVIGRKIGRPNSWGHFSFGFRGHTWMVHRVAWFLTYGDWPKNQIDHINGDKSDNRITNLRDVPQSINMQNLQGAHKNNESGFLGVSPRGEGRTKQWRACIKIKGKSITIGTFKTKEEAHAAYLGMKRKIHEGCTI